MKKQDSISEDRIPKKILQYHPGDEVRLKYGDFTVVITRTDVFSKGKHFEYAGVQQFPAL